MSIRKKNPTLQFKKILCVCVCVCVCVCTLIYTYWVAQKVHLGLCSDEKSEQTFWPIQYLFFKEIFGLFLPLGQLQNKARNHWLCYSLQNIPSDIEGRPTDSYLTSQTVFYKTISCGELRIISGRGKKAIKWEVQWEATHIHTLTYMLTN